MKIAIYIIITLGLLTALFRFFEKSGRKGWEALIPGYNLFVWLKIIHKPWWWLILLIFPGVNLLMLMVMCVNLSTVFGKREAKHVFLAAFLPFLFLPLLASNASSTYVGPIDRKKYPKSSILEWRDAIVFAIVAASIIRTYFLEAFTIPTSSMEKTLLIGDYLFVSKMSYGPKIPQTPLSFPFAHHTMPFTASTPSYLKWMDLPYFRLPGFGKVERNDVVVFNFPAGDTVLVDEQERAYEQVKREYAFQLEQQDLVKKLPPRPRAFYLNQAREMIHRTREITIRPVDKQENYIKRCVGIAGDQLEVKRGILYINGEMADIPEKFQYNYVVQTVDFLNKNRLKDDLGVHFQDQRRSTKSPGYIIPLTLEALEKTKQFAQVKGVMPAIKFDQIKNPKHWAVPFLIESDEQHYSMFRNATERIFPNDPNFPNYQQWNEDNFGPIYIPKKGETLELTIENLPIYHKAIGAYEGNDIKVVDNQILINNQTATSYTFKMNYYFMMGDNRHNSLDSRFWGFVPEDHVVGKGLFVWLSLDHEKDLFDGKIRWDRMFRLIK